MVQELVLKLDCCKLGNRVKALPGEGQNFNSFGRAEMENKTNFRYVLKPTFPYSISLLVNNFSLARLYGLDTIADGLKTVVYSETLQALLLVFDSGRLKYWLSHKLEFGRLLRR